LFISFQPRFFNATDEKNQMGNDEWKMTNGK
jgi:hypothetical protein